MKHNTKIVDEIIESYKDEMVQNLQEFLKIPSVKDAALPGMPFGKPINDAVLYLEKFLNDMGFAAKNYDGYAVAADYGKESKEVMGVLAHVDVVPAVGKWTYPPFEARIVDDKIYARGASDDKGPVMCSIYALKAIKEAGIELNKRKCRLLFGTDEESGWGGISYYQKHDKLPDIGISPDAAYPVINSEKGLYQAVVTKKFTDKTRSILEMKGGSRPNIVPDIVTAKVVMGAGLIAGMELAAKELGVGFNYKSEGDVYEIEVTGKNAHASMPYNGKNAITALITLLAMVNLPNAEQNSAIKQLAEKIGMQYNGQNVGLDITDESGNLTLNVGIIDMTQDSFELTIDIRYPRTLNGPKVTAKLTEALSEFEVKNKADKEPHFVSEDNELVKALLDIYSFYTGKEGKTVSIGGGTYARALPVGVSFGPGFPGEPELAHQVDEYEKIDNLVLNSKMIAAAIIEMCAE